MMSQLRWSLLIIGVVFIIALGWWERRRPRQASGSFERSAAREPAGEPPPRVLREPALTLPEMRAREPVMPRELPSVDVDDEATLPILPPARGEPVAPTLTVVAAAAPEPPELIEPAEPPQLEDAQPAQPVPATVSVTEASPMLPREVLPELPAPPAPVVEWPPDHERRILALRLVAPLPERFAGRSLRQALAAEGFVLGQFAIFHKPDEARRAVLSAASLTRPGTFDMETMDSQHYGGLSLFAVLPGPRPARQTFDELVFTARNLNERLHGVLQDEQGGPLTSARVALLREQLQGGANS
jgi:cell division protein ZipA